MRPWGTKGPVSVLLKDRSHVAQRITAIVSIICKAIRTISRGLQYAIILSSVAQPRILLRRGQSITSSVTEVVLSLSVPSVSFSTVENWYNTPVKILTSLFRPGHAFFGLILAAVLPHHIYSFDYWHGGFLQLIFTVGNQLSKHRTQTVINAPSSCITCLVNRNYLIAFKQYLQAFSGWRDSFGYVVWNNRQRRVSRVLSKRVNIVRLTYNLH